MDLQSTISKLTKKISSISESLTSRFPRVTISRFREVTRPVSSNLSIKNRLESLTGRLYSISHAGFGSSRNPEGKFMLASVSDEGELTIWNTQKGRPIFRSNIISSESWLMTCSFEKREGCLIATGGIEGKLHLFRLVTTSSYNLSLTEHPLISIPAHESYISSCAFLTSIDILTSSGDHTCKLWSLQANKEPLRVFKGHSDDVMSIATSPINPSLFLSGGCDSYTRLWDIRDELGNVSSFMAHTGHINSVRFLHDSEYTFATGNSNGTTRLYDLRTLREVGMYLSAKDVKGITSVEFSSSGRLLMSADELGRVKVWDLFDERVPVQVIDANYDQITGLELSPGGDQIYTCSLDCSITVIESIEPGN